MADIPTPEELDALDRLIGQRTRRAFSQSSLDPALPAMALAAQAVGDLALAQGEPDQAAVWGQVRSGMRPSSRRWGSQRWGWSARMGAGRLPALGSLAAAIVAAVVVAVVLVLGSDGTAQAAFLAAVDDLEEVSAEALDDAALSTSEAAAIEQRVVAVRIALDDEGAPISDLAPADLDRALATVAAVQRDLTPFQAQHDAIAASLLTLDQISTAVQAAIDTPTSDAAGDGGAARPSGGSGDSPNGDTPTPPAPAENDDDSPTDVRGDSEDDTRDPARPSDVAGEDDLSDRPSDDGVDDVNDDVREPTRPSDGAEDDQPADADLDGDRPSDRPAAEADDQPPDETTNDVTDDRPPADSSDPGDDQAGRPDADDRPADDRPADREPEAEGEATGAVGADGGDRAGESDAGDTPGDGNDLDCTNLDALPPERVIECLER